jgi:uncharacterized protein YcfJ
MIDSKKIIRKKFKRLDNSKVVKKNINKKKSFRKTNKNVFSNFIENENTEVKKYTKGAFIGGLVGGLGGLLIGRKIMLGIIIGALAGGYITYELNKIDTKRESKFKN